ncbi:hypothetical protein HYZ97_01265 [Candidatus Pacearchaeota archaeon]|nr:hypothetical protein [Candidatus Pacearchaeota archaeon]
MVLDDLAMPLTGIVTYAVALTAGGFLSQTDQPYSSRLSLHSWIEEKKDFFKPRTVFDKVIFYTLAYSTYPGAKLANHLNRPGDTNL